MLLSLISVAAIAADEPTPSPAWIRCTPTTIELPSGEIRPAENAIARALEESGPGSVIYLHPGDYPAFSIGFDNRSPNNARTSGGDLGFPVVVDGLGAVRIVGDGDTIAIDQAVANGYFTFRNLTIVPGRRSGVMFFRQSGKTHRGFTFEDCHILGGFDHSTGKGKPSKWGVFAHSVADFRFEGVRAPARIERIRDEHAFYIQNHRGPVLIRNVKASGLGRTFCQFTARAKDGAPGRGDITIRDCDVSDVGVAAGDAYKGGAAFTFAGRLECMILLERNVYRAGFHSSFKKLTTPGQPYGTGALVAWQGGERQRNGTLVLRDNRFLFAPGSGDRPVVSIGGCERVLIVGKNEFESGGEHPALSLDPLSNGEPTSSPNGSVFLAPETRLDGAVWIRDVPATEAELRQLERRSPQRR